MKWIKETPQTIVAEYKSLQYQIENLRPTEIVVNGNNYIVEHEIITTMLDGKAISALTNTPSSMTCPNCKANPKDFDKLDYVKNLQISEESLSYGISPLHMYIRALEYILHIAYRLDLKKWRVPKNEKPIMTEKKNEIQRQFRILVGLVIDQVQPGSGTSNTGNVARRFFSDPEFASEITGVNSEIITNLKYMLVALNSGFSINTEAFNEIGLETAKLHIEKYPWFKIPQSMHRLFIQASRIIENAQCQSGILLKKHWKLVINVVLEH